jgi:Transposase DNA-binding/Transposase Tn5 dimerisation domain
MKTAQSEREWAAEEFGLARLGDRRRVERLMRVGARVANQPAGKVTAVFGNVAEREGTFRLLENDAVAPEQIALASHRACARRAAGEPFAWVPVDGTSLNLVDQKRQKGLGVVGARCVGATGLQVMSALAVSRAGVPLGLCGQTYWAREERSGRRSNKDRRPVEEKETRHWLTVMQQARKVFASEAPQTRPWFQLDRGGDAWPVLLEGLQPGELFTVRAARDRRLGKWHGDEQRRYLWSTLESQPLLGTFDLEVRARPTRKLKQRTTPARTARTAKMELRACQISLELCIDQRAKWVTSPPLYALLACETAVSAGDEEPIEWMLLTSHPIASVEDAQLVLFGYAQRWRIEEFHKCWKSGVCKIEETQLRERDHIERWAVVLAAVAVRVLRLTYLARHAPELPALEELHPCEIDAIVLGAKSRKYAPGTVPPLAAVVDMLGRLGGYVGKSSGGPPGPLVLARGLLKIEVLADLLLTGVVAPTGKSDQ